MTWDHGPNFGSFGIWVVTEPDSSTLLVGYTTESKGKNSGMVLGDLKKHENGEVEVEMRRVAPTAIVVGKSAVRWAEVCGGDEDFLPFGSFELVAFEGIPFFLVSLVHDFLIRSWVGLSFLRPIWR